jgi:cell division inhibitor SepF
MASGILHKAMVYLGLVDEDYEDFEAYDEAPPGVQPAGRAQPEPQPAAERPVGAVRPLSREPSEGPNAYTAGPRPAVIRPMAPAQTARVHVVAPSRFADAQEIGDRFKNGQPVIVNLQASDEKLARRIIDFCSGVAYSLAGAMDKVADQVFLLTPSNVEVSAEEKKRLQERGLFEP